jgi:hypothetical protein
MNPLSSNLRLGHSAPPSTESILAAATHEALMCFNKHHSSLYQAYLQVKFELEAQKQVLVIILPFFCAYIHIFTIDLLLSRLEP